MSPPMCLKTAKDKYAAKVLEYHARLNKLEIDYLARKSKLEAKNKLLDDLEKEIETRQNKLDNHLIEKSFVALDLDSSSSSLSKTKSNKDILNNTLDDIAQITDQLKSSSLSDDINNKEADPATSSNVYKDNLKPIQPILKQYERFKAII
jgi:chromosome segregation ATPase